MEAKKEVPVPVMELESEESSTEEAEVESPRSVVVVEMRKKVERVHSQVLRIREEESHLGEDLVGRDKQNENDVVVVVRGGFHEKRRRGVNVVLACSPLSGKNNVKTPCGSVFEKDKLRVSRGKSRGFNLRLRSLLIFRS